MNTRSYPRTSRDAFPRTVEYASAIEGPQEPSGRWILFWAGASLALWTAFAYFITGA